MNVNVLGTNYEIKLCKRSDDPRLRANPDVSGYCDFSSKKIVLVNVILDSIGDTDTMDDLEFVQMNILKHELVHAYCFESGLDSSSPMREEMIVDFFALQLKKIYESCSDAEAQVHQELKTNIVNSIVSKEKEKKKRGS